MLALVLPATTRSLFNVHAMVHRLVGGGPRCFVLAQTLLLLEVWSKGPLASMTTTLQTMEVLPWFTMTRVVLHLERSQAVSVIAGTASQDQPGWVLDLLLCLWAGDKQV